MHVLVSTWLNPSKHVTCIVPESEPFSNPVLVSPTLPVLVTRSGLFSQSETGRYTLRGLCSGGRHKVNQYFVTKDTHNRWMCMDMTMCGNSWSHHASSDKLESVIPRLLCKLQVQIGNGWHFWCTNVQDMKRINQQTNINDDVCVYFSAADQTTRLCLSYASLLQTCEHLCQSACYLINYPKRPFTANNSVNHIKHYITHCIKMKNNNFIRKKK